MKTDKKKAKIVALYHAGTPVTALCKRFGVCKSTIYNWIQKYTSIKRKCRRTVTPEDVYRGLCYGNVPIRGVMRTTMLWEQGDFSSTKT